jgi:anti-anti-sigma factor
MPNPDPVGVSGAIVVQREPGGLVLCLSGEVDGAVVAAFEQVHGAMPVPVAHIDAAAVTFIGSAGLALLLRWVDVAAAAGQPLTLRRSSARLDRLLRLTGLDTVVARGGDAERDS